MTDLMKERYSHACLGCSAVMHQQMGPMLNPGWARAGAWLSTAASAREQSRTDLMAVLTGTLPLYAAVPLQSIQISHEVDTCVYFCPTVNAEITSSVMM